MAGVSLPPIFVNYSEASADGNYRTSDQQPYQLFGHGIVSYYLGPMYSHGDAIVPWLNLHKNLTGGRLLAVLAGAVWLS